VRGGELHPTLRGWRQLVLRLTWPDASRLYSVVSLLAVDRNGNLAGFSRPLELNASQAWSAPLRGAARPAAGSRTVMLQAQGVLFPGAMPTRLLADPSLASQILDQALAAHLPLARVLAEFGPAA